MIAVKSSRSLRKSWLRLHIDHFDSNPGRCLSYQLRRNRRILFDRTLPVCGDRLFVLLFRPAETTDG
jgi:hypothetical protein